MGVTPHSSIVDAARDGNIIKMLYSEESVTVEVGFEVSQGALEASLGEGRRGRRVAQRFFLFGNIWVWILNLGCILV